MKVLVTGNAGFIGFHVARALLARGDAVVGFDVVNDYYDPALKEARLAGAGPRPPRRPARDYEFRRADLADRAAVEAAFAEHRFDRVIHLAAQAGVRYSLENPLAYVESNIVGFTHILEACRQAGVAHLTYASTSSVYGANTRMPFTEGQGVDHPLQFYAATKRANELMAHAYSHLYRLPTTGLRFFTVYGPWGRPDMAPMLFASAILEGRPIKVYGHGEQSRDFTYIDDIVEGVIRASDRVAAPDPDWDPARPGPGHLRRPLPPLQHRQQRPRRPRRLHRRARGRPRQARHPRAPADAARRRARHLRRLDAAGAGGQLASRDADLERGGALRGLVPRLLRRGGRDLIPREIPPAEPRDTTSILPHGAPRPRRRLSAQRNRLALVYIGGRR